MPMMIRTGIGYDVHAFVEGRRLVLGGVEIEHAVGLSGHSDADVLCHAIADALLGAIGERDIGHHFPNTDEKWRGVSSLVILEGVREILQSREAVIHNVDSTLIAEAPKIGPHQEAMKAKIGRALGLKESQVGIKATTNEGLGFEGRKEGISAFAIATVSAPE